ncbi:hypothetical protein DJ018_18480 [Phenylobacterium deserti]|uniref:DUF2336 domain-containing protein n=2 Tax=Phenylobacterium deserti TaxID=1914756 RepID=A0A328A877_9CAUL|nr:hypothetical protein DJ018_18480 [Phenylobacterium deserti]
MAVTDLCGHGGSQLGRPEVQQILSDIFMGLVVEVERDVRRRLAQKLASAEWAPPALVNVLALDEIEIARPIIANSPVLKDGDLVRLLVEATIEHQIEVARRPNIGDEVVSAIIEQGEPAVLTALAGNPTAHVTHDALQALVDAAGRVAALRSPLARHPQLSEALARQLYVWVGQAVRHALAERFRLDQAALDRALADSISEAHAGARPQGEGLVVIARDGQREEMERSLVNKLYAAGQLRPSYLIRALREGRLTLFIAALAHLGGFESRQIRMALDSDRPELLALACAAVGIDRSVYPSILQMVRELNNNRPGGGDEAARKAAGAFGPVTPQVAGAAFRQAAVAG